LILLLFLAVAPPAASQEAQDLPRYALPEGFSRGEDLPAALAEAVERALRDVTRPAFPFAAREGWRVLAGIGRGAAPRAVEALREADWFGRSLLVRALGSMEEASLEPLLAEAARDPAWPVRAAAAEGMGFCVGAASAAALPGLLRDPSWRVRLAAVEAIRRRALLGTLPREAGSAGLLPLSSDPDEDVRRAAWLALAGLREPGARDPLLRALESLADRVQPAGPEDPPDPELAPALRLLRGVAEGWGEDPEVLAFLRNLGAVHHHPMAGAALREWFRTKGEEGARDPEAVKDLVEVYLGMQTIEQESRAAAEAALADLGEPAAAALLARVAVPDRAGRSPLLVSDPRSTLRLVLRLRGGKAAATLEGLLRDRDLPDTLRTLAAEVGRRTCPAALGPVFRDLLAADEGIYGLDAEVLKGVAASGGADVPALVARCLVRREGDVPPAGVRASAAEVLDSRPDLRLPGEIRRAVAAETEADILGRLLPVLAASGGPGAEEAVAPFLRDRRLRVRHAAARALSLLPGPRATALLLGVLESEDGTDERMPWYGEAGPTEEQVLELAALKDANAGGVRDAAVSSLRFAAGPGAAAALAALLGNPHPDVRGAAADNLLTLGDPAAAAALAARAEEEAEPGLRDRLLAALAALGGPAADAAFERWVAGVDAALRAAALRALGGESARARAPAGLRGFLAQAGAAPDERADALHALGRAADPDLTPVLLEALRAAATLEERTEALQALGLGRDPAAVEPVAALLPPGDPALLSPEALRTALQAVETLGDLRCERAAPALAALLARTLGPALLPGHGRTVDVERQAATLCLEALGKCGGEGSLDALVRAAVHPGFSRAAETATSNPLRPPPPRREGERWRPDVPEEIRGLARKLAASLARWKDPALAPALDRRLAEMRRDGRAQALGEEWLSWLGEALEDPPQKSPGRPRWWSRVVLARQVLAVVPRLSEADAAAARTLFLHEAEVTMEYAAARGRLAAWSDGLRVHDPLLFERSRREMAGLDRTAAAGAALRRRDGTGDPDALAAAFEESGREDAVARLGVEILTDLGLHLDAAVRLGEMAVGADAAYPPNLRALGTARLAAGDAAGASDALTLALEGLEGRAREPGRGSAWYRFYLGKALEALGRREEALRRLGEGALLNDVILDWIGRDPALEALRADPRAGEALRPAREAFD